KTPVVCLYEPACDRQAQPGPVVSAVGVPPVERLEDSRQLGVRDTGPPINDSDHQMAAHRSRSDPDRMPLRLTCSIIDKVRERSLQLGGVELDQRQIAMERHRESVAIPGSID